jgi:hypothetical protein
MKNVLSGNKIFQRKQLTPTHMLTEYQRTILPEYQKDSELGYEVPCEDFVFIFCSNYKLPTDAEVKSSIDKKGASKSSNRLMSLNESVPDVLQRILLWIGKLNGDGFQKLS